MNIYLLPGCLLVSLLVHGLFFYPDRMTSAEGGTGEQRSTVRLFVGDGQDYLPPVEPENSSVSEKVSAAESAGQQVGPSLPVPAPVAESNPSSVPETGVDVGSVDSPAAKTKKYCAEKTGSELSAQAVAAENSSASAIEDVDPPEVAGLKAGSGRSKTGPDPVSVEAAPRYGFCPRPAYPKRALERGWSGTVSFDVLVGADGKVRDLTLHASSGYRVFDRAAQKAIRSWTFTPARVNGVAVEGHVLVPFEFVLK